MDVSLNELILWKEKESAQASCTNKEKFSLIDVIVGEFGHVVTYDLPLEW